MESHKDKPQDVDLHGVDDAENVQHEAEKREDDMMKSKQEATDPEGNAEGDAKPEQPDVVEASSPEDSASENVAQEDSSASISTSTDDAIDSDQTAAEVSSEGRCYRASQPV